MVVAAPVAAANDLPKLASTIYKPFSYLCHQIPERSFHIGQNKFAVCSRCTGLYAGFALATLALPLVRPVKKTHTPRIIWLLLSVVPLVIDFALTYFGVWENNHFTRVVTAVLFGAVSAAFIVPGLIELSSNVANRLRHSSRVKTEEPNGQT